MGVVRQDPVSPSLLFAGTRRGAFVSFDDGGSWQRLQLNLPTTGVNDLTVHGNDLIAATEGRSLWVLDDVSPLRHLGAATAAAAATAISDLTLFPPAPAYRITSNQNRDTPLPLDEPRTLNPPAGAVIDYWLPAGTQGAVTLEIVDGQGRPVRRFRNDETPERPEARQYFANDWLQSPAALPARAGHNRFVWDLRTLRPRLQEYEYSIAAVPGADTPELPQGLFVPPGTYELRLKAAGRTLTAPLTVLADPRSGASPADLTAQRDFYETVAQTLEKITDAQQRVDAVTKRLQTLDGDLASRPKTDAIQQSVKRLLADAGRFATGSSEDNLAAIAGVLTPLATDLESADRAPTGPQREVYETYKKRLDKALADWQALENGPLLDLRKQLRAAGLQPVV